MATENIDEQDKKTEEDKSQKQDKVTDNKDSGEDKGTEVDLSKFVSVDEFERTKAALAKANREAADNRHKLKDYTELGISSEELKDLVTERAEKEEERKRQEGKFEEILNERISEFEKKIAEKDSLIEESKKRMESYLVNGSLTSALNKEGVSEKVGVALLKDKVKVVDSDGEMSVVVVDGDGSPLMNKQGKAMSVHEYVVSLKDDDEYSQIFPAPDKKGVDANGKQNKSTNWSGPKQRSKMSFDQRLEYQKKFGFDEYNKLPF